MRLCRRIASAAVIAAGLALCPRAAADPPGFNVHPVLALPTGTLWRGGAPREATLRDLAATAFRSGRRATLIDLRHPPTRDDLSGKGGRLSPGAEEAVCRQLGMDYISISALDPALPAQVAGALAAGDAFMHCMYGVNRTGFAAARLALASGAPVDRQGLGPRDWAQGGAYQLRLAASGRGAWTFDQAAVAVVPLTPEERLLARAAANLATSGFWCAPAPGSLLLAAVAAGKSALGSEQH